MGCLKCKGWSRAGRASTITAPSIRRRERKSPNHWARFAHPAATRNLLQTFCPPVPLLRKVICWLHSYKGTGGSTVILRHSSAPNGNHQVVRPRWTIWSPETFTPTLCNDCLTLGCKLTSWSEVTLACHPKRRGRKRFRGLLKLGLEYL